MLSLGIRNLLRERVRLLVSVGGVAFAVLLIVLIRGLFVAYQTRVADYFGQIRADLWVVEPGTADFFHSFSIVPDELRAEIATTPGVESVQPYVARLVALDVGDTDTVMYLVGVEREDPAVGPAHIVEGTGAPSRHGIVIDQVFARANGLDVDDTLELEGHELRIEGIATGGDLVMFQYAFTQLPTAREILGFEDIDTALLVSVDPDADRAEVAASIERSEEVLTRDTADIVTVNQRPLTEGFLPVVRVLLVLGFAVGVAVVGLTIYSSVIERRREYGMLKALGARPRHLVAVVGSQALLAAAIGYAVGVALAFGARNAAEQWVPQFITELESRDIALVALATLGMAFLSAILPLVRVVRIDPGEVFDA